MGNRIELAVEADVSHATGTAERDNALALIGRHTPRRRVTLAADKLLDVEGFVTALRARRVTPHIAVDGRISRVGAIRRTAVDRRIMLHLGVPSRLRLGRRIEKIFDWAKTAGGVAKVNVRGLAKIRAVFTFAIAADNLIRIPKLLKAPT